MPARVQNLIFALSAPAQSNISTASTATLLRMRKLNMNLTTPDFMTENDKDEIGKGNEFINEVFPVAYDVKNTIEKYGSSEFLTWAFGYGLGVASVSGSGPYTYTITPLDPATTLELPYFSVVEQLAEGGGNDISNVHVGCAIEEVSLAFNYGPGRQSVKMNVGFIGSGILQTATGISVPTVLQESYYLSQSMQITINGNNYVSAKTILSGAIGWKNNLLASAGYYPGSGIQNGAAVRGRIEIGNRVPTFSFKIRLLHTSTEYAQMVALTTGTGSVSFSNGPYSTTFSFGEVSFTAVELDNTDGIVTLNVTVAPMYPGSLASFLTISSITSIGTIL